MFISCLVFSTLGATHWLISVVYGPTRYFEKIDFWQNINQASSSRFVGPWLLIGDFNDILWNEERVGGRSVDLTAPMLIIALDEVGMIELIVAGAQFSWSNGREGDNLVQSKIDRAMANFEWGPTFPNASLCFLRETTSGKTLTVRD